jgi:PKD repeat protein
MRSIRLLAATTVIVLGAAGCGDEGNGPDNDAPNASFTQVCTGLSCVFTDGSTDSDGTIASRSWTFESGTPPTSTEAAPTITFAAAGTYTVTLAVTDNEGATGNTSQEVVVTDGGTGNLPPTASFTLTSPTCTAGTPCGFHSTSTDDVAILSTSWQFGDGGTAEGTDATHTYAAAGTPSVTLTVTDDQGLTGTVTLPVTVTAPSAQDCTTSTNQSGGRIVNCTLSFTTRSTVSLTIDSRSCELGGNSLSVTAPRSYVIFPNLCFAGTLDVPVTVNDVNGDPIVFEAGSTISLRFNQGTADPGDPVTGDPGIEVTGTAPNWILNIDDGGNAGAEGEPDFDDAVINVTATAAP